ncbi:T9SS type A sorting domain-containing protein [Aquimarina sp. 2-A2]|uniref:T9SS type A sorting domain-containing protein n=1 Tax=Aquimarina sp. 2-A2 TaxID=3382644 RepID=UPI00387F2FB9
MKKIYSLILLMLLISLSFTYGGKAQSDSAIADARAAQVIDGLRIYPNPATGNILNISSDRALTKTVTIYNVLGAKVLFKVLIGKELDISSLNSGVYIIQIKEEKKTATRKLVIR